MNSINQITHAKIHPAIGIARVGNSPTEYFIGPETCEEESLPPGHYKDATGALKRQACRFRVYGYSAAGDVVAELTAASADITWTAHLANKKAAWYEFKLALDIPEASLPGAEVSRRRNPQVVGEERKKLVIDPGPRSIRGKSTQGASYQFDHGKFFNLETPLGELQTDDEGRLLLLGGFGLSRSIVGQPPLDFANNNGWHDDVSDGPVDAKVILAGKEIPVEGAWAIVAPPNYAPSLKTVRTLFDLLYDRFIAWKQLPPLAEVSFSRHIAPIFKRLSALQWVNQGFAAAFGYDAPMSADHLLFRLSDASEENKEFRQQIYAQFRNPKESNLGKWLWPSFYGDALDSLNNDEHDASVRVERGLASLTPTQLSCLRKWAIGDFQMDLKMAASSRPDLAAIPLAQQPAELDEAALSFCLADAFHPGCEITWIIRQRSLYNASFRIRRRPLLLGEPDYGDVLAPDVAISPTGPLSSSSAGDLTRWMAVPWQTDTASCLSGYTSFFNTTVSLPTFWPARVPNQVLREREYAITLNPAQPLDQRIAAFRTRKNWFRGFTSSAPTTQMITDFHKLGIIEERPGPVDSPLFPSKFWVESKPELPEPKEESNEHDAAVRLATSLRRPGQKHQS